MDSLSSTDEISRIALLVAPSYKRLPEKYHLPGTAYDLRVMEEITKKLQFVDVTKVVGDEATKENILGSLGDLSRTTKHGDIALFYFSGHGCYLPRTKDEALVPADATFETLKDSGEEICITGRDFIPFWEQLTAKDVKVTVIFDCCHSGQLYRILEFRNSENTDMIRLRQVLIKNYSKTESPSAKESEETGSKLLRGGWTPTEKDAFFFIAACTPQQLAAEEYGRGGRLTMAIESVFNSIYIEGKCSGKVSIRAFFRLIVRESKKKGWYEKQTPQLEGECMDTELFGVDKVPSPKSGITVMDVNGDEVILEAGCLQNVLPGDYDVFETTATEADLNIGRMSSNWLGTIDVSEGLIGAAQSSSLIVARHIDKNKKISPGCLAFLKTPSNIKTNAWVKIPSDLDSVLGEGNIHNLLQGINDTKILNASRNLFKIEDEDLITIDFEPCETSAYPVSSDKKLYNWVARRRGHVIVPPISLGKEEIMVTNLSRYLRYQFALASAEPPKSPDELLKNVSFKVVKMEKVKPFKSKFKEERIKEGLQSGKDLYEDASQYPVLLGHSLWDPVERNKLKDETGDAFIFQVTNHNEKEEDTVHICVLFYQFDGAIKPIYPPKKGCTAELRGGDTAEDIFRVFIPFNSLRKLAQPDPKLPEPDRGVDTIVVYATSKPADFEALLQTAIEIDPNITPRGDLEEKANDLSNFAKFSLPIRKRCLEDHPDEDFKWVVEKREFAVLKNTNSTNAAE